MGEGDEDVWERLNLNLNGIRVSSWVCVSVLFYFIYDEQIYISMVGFQRLTLYLTQPQLFNFLHVCTC